MDRKEKIKAAGIKRYGSEEAWRQAMREYGARANRFTPRGFGTMKDKELQSEISKKGAAARWAKEADRVGEQASPSEEDSLEDGHFTKKDSV